MIRVISATVYIQDTCDPDVPGNCAPVVEVEDAVELEGLVSEYGISFEEALREQEDELVEDVTDEEDPELEIGSDEIPEDQLECPLDPDVEWDESVCGQIERRILIKVLGG